jgi:hypothetical protein
LIIEISNKPTGTELIPGQHPIILKEYIEMIRNIIGDKFAMKVIARIEKADNDNP